MTVEFVKAHTGKDGRTYAIGQIADVRDNDVQDLIRQGVAKEHQTDEPAKPPKSNR